MSDLARRIASADIQDERTKIQLQQQYGLEEEDLVNNALVTARIFQEAAKGNMRAAERWEELTKEVEVEDNSIKIPAEAIGSAFVDINRHILPNIKYVFKGGRGGLKSSYISLKIIELLLSHSMMHACVVRRVGQTLKDSVYAQLKWAITTLGLENDFEFKKSPLEIVYKTGQTIYFRGADDPLKLKSIKPPYGYIGILWKEEWDQLAGPEEDRSINQSVLRGGPEAYEFCSFNPPRTIDSWVNRVLLEPDDKRIVHSSTYLAAPAEWLGQKFLDDAEHLKEVNPKAYEHEYMGVANGDGGAVFEFIEPRTITNEEIGNFDKLYAGVDWGYYPDPFCFLLVHYDPQQEKVYLIDELYAQKLQNKDSAEWILKNHPELVQNGVLKYGIICDSAEKKSVADFVDLGIRNAKAAYKPPGSVAYGIKWLQARTLVIDRNRTPHAYEEIVHYEYEKDKDGDVVSGYPDENNHAIDALRYSLSPVFLRRGTTA